MKQQRPYFTLTADRGLSILRATSEVATSPLRGTQFFARDSARARCSMNTHDSLKIDKTVFTVTRLSDPSDEKEYWLSRSPYERLQAVETLRRLNYGEHQSTARLQRVLEVTQRASG